METSNEQPAQETQVISPKPSKKRKIIKIVLVVAGVLMVLLVFLFSMIKPSPLEHYRWQKEAEQKLADQEKMICDDVYGGDTPEETYTMYRDAMTQKDVDKAMLYVDLFNRDRMRKYIDGQDLDDFIKNDLPLLDGLKKTQEGQYIFFTYERYVPPFMIDVDGKNMPGGDYNDFFRYRLVQNRCNDKWKIVGL
jgi:hypothetical protein